MSQPAIPLPAATVVLARRHADGSFEVFMNLRPDHLDTYAGTFVFPGGRVEPEDHSEEIAAFVHGLSPDEAQRILGSDSPPNVCRGYWVAALRELFEEAGIHFFAGAADKAMSDSESLTRRLNDKRGALQRGQVSFAELLRSEQISCDLSRLTYFYHRVTPDHFRIRFDTRFYLAALPQGQCPDACAEEVAETLWIKPKDALQRGEGGNFRIMPPTVAVLSMLASRPTWDQLCRDFRLL